MHAAARIRNIWLCPSLSVSLPPANLNCPRISGASCRFYRHIVGFIIPDTKGARRSFGAHSSMERQTQWSKGKLKEGQKTEDRPTETRRQITMQRGQRTGVDPIRQAFRGNERARLFSQCLAMPSQSCVSGENPCWRIFVGAPCRRQTSAILVLRPSFFKLIGAPEGTLYHRSNQLADKK